MGPALRAGASKDAGRPAAVFRRTAGRIVRLKSVQLTARRAAGAVDAPCSAGDTGVAGSARRARVAARPGAVAEARGAAHTRRGEGVDGAGGAFAVAGFGDVAGVGCFSTLRARLYAEVCGALHGNAIAGLGDVALAFELATFDACGSRAHGYADRLARGAIEGTFFARVAGVALGAASRGARVGLWTSVGAAVGLRAHIFAAAVGRLSVLVAGVDSVARRATTVDAHLAGRALGVREAARGAVVATRGKEAEGSEEKQTEKVVHLTRVRRMAGEPKSAQKLPGTLTKLE